MVREIDSEDLRARMSANDDFILLDIRTQGEVARGVLPQARHIPMHLIPLRLEDLPEDKDVVLYCNSGARSYHACNYLQQQGFSRVLNLRGGILGWARGGYRVAQKLAG